jgi:PrgI family protein
MDSVAVPQHLDLEDVVAWGLTATDLLCVVAGIAFGWWLMLRIPGSLALQLAVGAPPALIGLALGMVRIGDTPLRRWLVVALSYTIRPRVLVT